MAVGIVLAISFIGCVILTYIRPTPAFYLLPTRCWELLSGGMVFLFRRQQAEHTSRYAEMAGLFCVVLSCFMFDRFTPWPGYLALFPTLGACLIIMSDRGPSSMLRSNLFQLVGKGSYSIYLWHWPLIAGARYFFGTLNAWIVAALLVATVVLGFSSYYLVERPGADLLKRSLRMPAQRLVPISLVIALFGVGLLIGVRAGIPSRADSPQKIAATISAREAWAFPEKECEGFLPDREIKTCQVGTGAGSPTLVIGDSEAQEWYPRYLHLAETLSMTSPIVFATHTGCSPLIGVERLDPGHQCGRFAEGAFQLALNRKFSRIVFIASWVGYFGDPTGATNIAICKNGMFGCTRYVRHDELLALIYSDFQRQLQALVQTGADIIVILPLPVPGFSVPEEMAKREFWHEDVSDLEQMSLGRYLEDAGAVREALSVAATKSGAHVVDPIEFMCHHGGCPLMDEEGRSLYKDAVHLTPKAVSERYAFLDTYLGQNNQ
jgi:hypothetical protein